MYCAWPGSQDVCATGADVRRRQARQSYRVVDHRRNDRHTEWLCLVERGSGGQRHRRHRGCVRSVLVASVHDQHYAVLLSRLPRAVPSHRRLYSAVALQLGLEPGSVCVGSPRLSICAPTARLL